MNLIEDLGNDLATAFLLEKKYDPKVSKRERQALIGKIREALSSGALAESSKKKSAFATKAAPASES